MSHAHRPIPWYIVLVVGGVFWSFGCGSRPHAPALRNDPVYQNDQEGFRFMVPEGWAMLGNGALPKGKFEKEFMLVRYMRKSAEKRATLEVSLIDLPPSADLAAYLAGPSYGAKKWQTSGPPAPVQANGMEGQRFLFSGKAGKDDLTKEVVAFRRGDRVYLFTGLYPPKDASARDQVRQAVASTLWKG